ncbi:uncharacterized protein G2W53_002141 [Senna tora]|uniref:Uncharacterized protein n=1 Tax=Senna tora TaxID=362788 RepID=A0A835CG04_9FABA|nr:uncharacterized protein G2W53_003704 [Senna tora]KAF7845236.1 uncharacterized protein G2W53_002141 [Senna tora]
MEEQGQMLKSRTRTLEDQEYKDSHEQEVQQEMLLGIANQTCIL